MSILRDNRDSVLAMLEAFVYDPLISWRLLTDHKEGDLHRPEGTEGGDGGSGKDMGGGHTNGVLEASMPEQLVNVLAESSGSKFESGNLGNHVGSLMTKQFSKPLVDDTAELDASGQDNLNSRCAQ